jgi:acetylornithine deacetylase/succinyl-diaminopimelate desuccinylase-like protein
MRKNAIFILGGLLVLAACRQTGSIHPDLPEWQYEIARKPERWMADPAIRLLHDYVQIDTTDPPGNERRGAEFLKAYLECEGIASELICPEKDRCNLYARLRGREPGGTRLLLNHIDVVPAYPPYWKFPPFGAAIDKSYLYGRGSYDMKSIGIAQMLAFVDLAKSGIVPRRDVIFLAECGEENGGTDGVSWIFEHRPDLLSGVSFVLNEGGYQEMVAGNLRYWGIEIAQAGMGTALLTADDARTVTFDPPFRGLGLHVTPEPIVQMYLNEVAEFRAPFFANAFRHPDLLRDPEVLKWIPFQNLSLITGGVYYAPPFPARLLPVYDFGRQYDAPLTVSLPLGVDPCPYLDAVLAEAGRRGASWVSRECSGPLSASPYPTPDTEAIRRVLQALLPGIPLLPMINSFAGTTSVEFRKRGIPAYGFTPFQIDPADAARRHGNDERIFLPFYTRGVTAMREVLFELAPD